MDHKSVRKLLPESDTAAADAVKAAAKLIEKRRRILLELAQGDFTNLKKMLEIADAIEVAAQASIWETELKK